MPVLLFLYTNAKNNSCLIFAFLDCDKPIKTMALEGDQIISQSFAPIDNRNLPEKPREVIGQFRLYNKLYGLGATKKKW